MLLHCSSALSQNKNRVHLKLYSTVAAGKHLIILLPSFWRLLPLEMKFPFFGTIHSAIEIKISAYLHWNIYLLLVCLVQCCLPIPGVSISRAIFSPSYPIARNGFPEKWKPRRHSRKMWPEYIFLEEGIYSRARLLPLLPDWICPPKKNIVLDRLFPIWFTIVLRSL